MLDSSSRQTPPPDSAAGVALLVPGSETSTLIHQIDWAKTPLGPIRAWPRSLLALVGVMLHSRHPMFLWWGEELIQLYNDAYVPSFGRGKHPAAMGQRGRDCWREIWPIIGPQIDAVMRRGMATWHEDALVPIERNGRIEEVYWTYGYSPAFDDTGHVGGTLVVCTETTPRVLSGRRSDVLRRLGERLSSCSTQDELLPTLAESLQAAPEDVAFFASTTPDTASESSFSLPDAANEGIVTLEPPRSNSAWPEPVTQAVIIRCPRQSTQLVFGVSPRLPLDDAYRGFFRQIAEELEQSQVRIEAFRARAAAESQRRNLILQAPIATAIVTGPRHVYELTNPAYQELVGGRDVIGKAYVEAFPEAAGTELERILDRVYRTGEPYLAEEYLVALPRGDDGKHEDVYFRVNLEPIRNTRGQVYGIMVLATDITHEVSARRVVEKAAAEREKLLTQLEAAGHAKDEFLATVSHELRTPLTSILGWARLLTEGKGDPARLQKGLAAIERNAKAQAKLIEDILDVSRIVSGKVRLSMRRVEPAAVVQGAVETVRPLASAKQQRLLVDLEPGLPALNADEDRLQQVVWNLLSNAVKFTPEQGEIRVSGRRVDDTVLISVKDNGKGISPKFLPHVFDRFRQDDTSTTKQQAGLGLGLAIVRHLIDLHGGTVSAASDGPGTGSTFSFALPVRASTPHQDVGSVAPPDHVASGVSNLGRLRGVHVLVVDDQDDARDLLATVLEDAGAQVSQARSVELALALLAAEEIQIVVSDIGMPDEDGYSFMRRLRAAGSGQQIPAVAVTAFARAEDRLRAIRAGFQDHISKPIDPGTLIDVVASLLQR